MPSRDMFIIAAAVNGVAIRLRYGAEQYQDGFQAVAKGGFLQYGELLDWHEGGHYEFVGPRFALHADLDNAVESVLQECLGFAEFLDYVER